MKDASRGSRNRSFYIFISLAVVAAGIALAVSLSGGFSQHLFGLRLSSRGPVRPALFSLLFLAIAYRCMPDLQQGAVSQFTARVLGRLTLWIAPAAATVVLVLCWVYGTRAAGASDVYGYVSQARLWMAGDLHVHQDFAAAVPWPNADWSFTPL